MNIGIGIANAIGFNNKRGGIVIPPQIKDSIVLWYDIGKQTISDIIATNKLKDISNHNLDGDLIDFGFEGSNIELVFDGIGYVKTSNLPILENYTVIAKRTNNNNQTEEVYFSSLGGGDLTSASRSLFWMEGGYLNNIYYSYSKGYKNPIFLPESITYQTTNSYNGNKINISTGKQVGNNLFIGCVGDDSTHKWMGVLEDYILFNRELTKEEIKWVIDNMINNDVPSVDKSLIAFWDVTNWDAETNEIPNIEDKNGQPPLFTIGVPDNIENGMMWLRDDDYLKMTTLANCRTVIMDINIKSIDNNLISVINNKAEKLSIINDKGKLFKDCITGYLNDRPAFDIIGTDTLNKRYILAATFKGGLGVETYIEINNILNGGTDTLGNLDVGKVALYNRQLTYDEINREVFDKQFAFRYSTTVKNVSVHVFRETDKELIPGEYILPFETIYIRVDCPIDYIVNNLVIDNVEYEWKYNTPIAFQVPEHDIDIIAMAVPSTKIENWILPNIDNYPIQITPSLNELEFLGSTNDEEIVVGLNQTDIASFDVAANITGDCKCYIEVNDSKELITSAVKHYDNVKFVKVYYIGNDSLDQTIVKFKNVIKK